MVTSWHTVISKFYLIYATDERSFVSEKAFHNDVLGKPIDPWQWASRKPHMEGLSRQNSSRIGRKNPAKLTVSQRNAHVIKTTQVKLNQI